MSQDYHNLIVCQKAIDLTLFIYRISNGFPGSELYGLTSQIRRASVSAAGNIAEGRGRAEPCRVPAVPGYVWHRDRSSN
ncbi:MAG TPA: four helix bundle protein [Terracidiphilus sp.]